MNKELHVISNGDMSLERFADIAGQLEPWVTAFHVREKAKSAAEVFTGLQLLFAANVPTSKTIVNDRVDIAWAANVGTVQLSGHSLGVALVKQRFPLMLVGRSVHSPEEGMEAQTQGADFLIYGHIYSSSSKPDLPPRGLSGMQQLARTSRVPVLAIGGIRPDNVKEVMAAGAAGVAVISGILEAGDPVAAAKDYYQALHEEGGMKVETRI